MSKKNNTWKKSKNINKNMIKLKKPQKVFAIVSIVLTGIPIIAILIAAVIG